MRGIDVSVHNGNIDWNRVKNDGIGFAILRGKQYPIFFDVEEKATLNTGKGLCQNKLNNANDQPIE